MLPQPEKPTFAGFVGTTDLQLLSAHIAGDPHAFTELMRRHYDRLWHVAVRTSYTREEAADALQDALLSAHRTASRFRGESAVGTWLHTIVVNACLDRIRRNKTRPTTSLTPGDDVIGSEPADDRNRISEFETSHVVYKALHRLSPEARATIVAVDVEGYSVAETAVMLGVPEGTIKSRCARARLKLAENLEFLRDPRNRS